MSVLFPNFWDIRYKKKKEPAPIKNLLTWFVADRGQFQREMIITINDCHVLEKRIIQLQTQVSVNELVAIII